MERHFGQCGLYFDDTFLVGSVGRGVFRGVADPYDGLSTFKLLGL
ncbi:unnamed protein product, partial [Rotaria sp. Silwood1]